MNAKVWLTFSLAVFGGAPAGAMTLPQVVHAKPAQYESKGEIAEPTFNKEVAPIIFSNCAFCHRPGGSGPFSLLSYSDVKKHARQIVAVTHSRFMPPWLPEPGYGTFIGDRRLNDQQIRTLQRWVARGTQEGLASDLPSMPKFREGWRLGKPDLVIQLPQPYIILAGHSTDSWPLFVLPVPATGTHYVKGIEINPGNPKIVHHCYIALDRNQMLRIANGEIYASESTGMENRLGGSGAEPDSRFLTWRPGTSPYFEPEGATWRLDKDTVLTLVLHLLAQGKSEVIRPTVAFYFSDKPPTKFPTILRLEHDGDIDIPPGAKDYTVSDDLVLPVDVKVLSVLPHAHYLCKEMRAYATLPDGTRRWLIWIKHWNFDWQGVFRYVQPIALPKGTILSMRYTYDNSAENPRNPNSPPKRVVGGPNSTNEMADLWLEVLPRQRSDLFELEIALMQHKVAKYSHDLDAYADLGAALHAKGRNQEALGPLREAARLNGDDVQVQNNLGAVLGSLGDLKEATIHFREALKIRPDYFMACFNLANALRLQGDLKGAAIHFQEAVHLRPDNVAAYDKLGLVYAQQGNLIEAVTQFRNALRIQPNDLFARESLTRAQAAMGNVH